MGYIGIGYIGLDPPQSPPDRDAELLPELPGEGVGGDDHRAAGHPHPARRGAFERHVAGEGLGEGTGRTPLIKRHMGKKYPCPDINLGLSKPGTLEKFYSDRFNHETNADETVPNRSSIVANTKRRF